jgi:hypothetical protein
MSASDATTSFRPDQPAALGLTERAAAGTIEEDDEWEYEYSSTETEVRENEPSTPSPITQAE